MACSFQFAIFLPECYDAYMKRRNLLFNLLQFTWGLPQTLMGLVLYRRYKKCPHRSYKGVIFTDWKRPGGISLGPFIFAEQPEDDPELCVELMKHEYGHSLQSLMLGPLYLPLIGLPSVLWANVPYFKKRRRRKQLSYYRMYAERWASKLGKSKLV